MQRALALCGLSLDGAHHRGIDDARNIARMLPFMLDNNLKRAVAVNLLKEKEEKRLAVLKEPGAREKLDAMMSRRGKLR